MKKLLLSLSAVALACNMSFAQEDMSIVWEQKMEHKIDFNGTGTEERGYSYAASDKEITVFNNKDGKTIWTKPYTEVAPKLRKIDELIPFWESNTIFLFERKMGKDQIACVDMQNGSLLWNTDKYQNISEDVVLYIPEEEAFAIALKEQLVFIKARTGEELWSTTKFKGAVGQYVYSVDDKTMVMVNFVPSGLGALFTGFKNQIAKINLKNGEILWENTYIGRAERKVITREFLYELDVVGDKVFLRMNGMQVYDYKTGANLWSAAFDFTPDIIAAPSGVYVKHGVYGAVADPVIVGDDIYVLDMSNKKSQYVKKYDRNTGKLIWSSPEIKGARAIPGMYIVDDMVILQIGGKVEEQYYRKYKNSEGEFVEEWVVRFPEVKPFGVKAFNAADGKMAWESERFKKGITNAIALEKDFIVCSGKALYSMDIKTGAEKYEVPVTKGGVGQASLIEGFENNIIVVGEKGISSFKSENGDLVCSGKYKASSLEDRIDNVMILKTAGADIACFDLASCAFKEFKARKGASTTLSLDAKYVYVYENKTVTKLITK